MVDDKREARFGKPPTEEPLMEYWNPPYLISNPPSGKCKVLNIYFDPDLRKVVVERILEEEP